jgi:hypothetical protein
MSPHGRNWQEVQPATTRQHLLYLAHLSVEGFAAVQAFINMLLQSKAPTAGHVARTASSSSIRRVQPMVTRRRLVVADAALKDTAAVSVMEKGELSVFPEQPAVYAVYDKDGAVQYIGLTRKVIS